MGRGAAIAALVVACVGACGADPVAQPNAELPSEALTSLTSTPAAPTSPSRSTPSTQTTPATPSTTPKATPTRSPTPTIAATPTRSATATRSPTPTLTKTRTPTPTPTAPPASTTAPPTEGVPAALAGRVLTVLPTNRKVVALTFDGGASDTGVAPILGTLRAQGVRASFFVTGDFARRYPDGVRAMAAAGHRVGNHSSTHPDFTTLRAAQQVDQLRVAESVIHPLTGTSTAPWFRFPFGASNSAALATVNGQGYAAIGWTVDTLGWKGTSGGQSVASVVDRVLAGARSGEIVLLHVGANPDDGTTLDADALPRIISELKARGYGFVTLDAALA